MYQSFDIANVFPNRYIANFKIAISLKKILQTVECLNQSFDTANQRFSELAAAQEFFSDFINDSN